MSFSYDPSTPVGLVRLLSGDTSSVSPGPIFQDEEITALLSLELQSVRYAAAQALEIIAASEVLIQKRIKTLDLQTDGVAESAELRELAKQLRKSEEDTGAFDYAEMINDPFGARERIYKQFLRLRQ